MRLATCDRCKQSPVMVNVATVNGCLRETSLEDVAMNINTEKRHRRGGQPYSYPHPILPASVPVVSQGAHEYSSEITVSVEYERVGLAIGGNKATMSIEAARALVALLQEAASKAMDTYVENRR